MNIVVVLGKRLNDDGSMRKELIGRIESGIQVFNENKADYLCVTGGMPNKKAALTEASQMYAYLIEKDFPEEKIIYEDRSLTTWGNAMRLKKLLKDETIDRIFLVSSKYHFHRKNFGTCDKIFKKRFKNVCIVNCEVEE